MDKFKGEVVEIDYEKLTNEEKRLLTNSHIYDAIPYGIINNVKQRTKTYYSITLTGESAEPPFVTLDGSKIKPLTLEGMTSPEHVKLIQELQREDFISALEPLPTKVYRVAEYLNDNENRKDVVKELKTLYADIRMGHVTEDDMARRIAAYLTNLANKLLT